MFAQSLCANVPRSFLQERQERGAAQTALGRIGQPGSVRPAEHCPGTNRNRLRAAWRRGRAWGACTSLSNARTSLSDSGWSAEAARERFQREQAGGGRAPGQTGREDGCGAGCLGQRSRSLWRPDGGRTARRAGDRRGALQREQRTLTHAGCFYLWGRAGGGGCPGGSGD